MKTARVGSIAGAIVAVVVMTSCSINHKSDQYACKTTAECEPGRVCSAEGFCVVSGTAVDAPRGDAGRGDANNCPAGCTSCNTALKTCTIDCTLTNCTNNTIACPAGYKCDIACNTDGACRNGVNCQQAAACAIECTGKSSCENVQCGPGPCSVGCSGPSSCRGVSCGNSCACDVLCTGNQSCAQNIQCSSLACRSGLGCTSVPTFCHSCN